MEPEGAVRQVNRARAAAAFAALSTRCSDLHPTLASLPEPWVKTLWSPGPRSDGDPARQHACYRGMCHRGVGLGVGGMKGRELKFLKTWSSRDLQAGGNLPGAQRLGYTALQEDLGGGRGDKTVRSVGVVPNTPHPQARTSWPLEALRLTMCKELLGPTRGPQCGEVRVSCVV